ncbi:hypothetical protein [Sporomusa termitida]|uniref:Uncharacterized protein n=1 Tax=Sporomusa termitida TaxID=2377 RepID=A0A517DVK4_9FIRM|nr:hypothetical protein [Sporomusa termitida]QDR81394.1 hypothetical protein SPTER_27740 [Sporomusa termitida]
MTIIAGVISIQVSKNYQDQQRLHKNTRSGIMYMEVDSGERTYYKFTKYPYLPADGSDILRRPMYGQVGGNASV